MSRKNYKSEKDYRKAKKAERQRYYHSLPTYEQRRWNTVEEEMVACGKYTAMELASMLHRSVKAIEHKRAGLRKKSKEVT